jgi:hypothetical protein
MQIPIDLWIYLAAAAGATFGFLFSTILSHRKRVGQYNRGWNAGREFTLRNLHDTITR